MEPLENQEQEAAVEVAATPTEEAKTECTADISVDCNCESPCDVENDVANDEPLPTA